MTTRLTFDQSRFIQALAQLQTDSSLEDLQLAARINCAITTLRSWKKNESKPTLTALLSLYKVSKNRAFLPDEFLHTRSQEVEQLMLDATGEQIADRLKQVYEIGKKVGLWDTLATMVRVSGCLFDVGSSLKLQLEERGSHCSVFVLLDILEKSQRKLNSVRDDLVNELGAPATLHGNPATVQGNGTTSVATPSPAPVKEDDRLVAVSTRHLDKFAAGVRQLMLSLGEEVQLDDPHEVKGVVHPAGMTVGGVRFALTANHFPLLDGDVTDREIEDTILLMEELRRRWSLFARLPDDVRERLLGRLGPEIDEFFLTLLANKEQLPANAVELLEAQRDAFSQLAGRHKGGKKR